jgi:hypothetical protein
MSNVAAKRLQVLEAMMEAELTYANPDYRFIDDLKLSIEQCKLDIKNSSKDGYRMVEV